jgi:hypothetical protein
MKIALKIICFLLLSTLTHVVIAQNAETEVKQELFPAIAPRVGIGIHNYPNYELGVSALYISNRGLQWGAVSVYSTYIIQQTDWQPKANMNGFKVGAQSSWAIFMIGLEWKSLNYEDKNFSYLSPKVGLSWLDVVNVEYLKNVIDIKESNPLQSRHQVAVNMSLNKRIYNNIWKK